MLIKAIEWRDRLRVLSSESKNADYVREHIEILEWLINSTGNCTCENSEDRLND